VAILIDATLVRGVLLPAAMALLGDKAWSLPGRPPPHRDEALREPAPSPATATEEPLVTRLNQRY
jgi:RND superfamily putative drug exporter